MPSAGTPDSLPFVRRAEIQPRDPFGAELLVVSCFGRHLRKVTVPADQNRNQHLTAIEEGYEAFEGSSNHVLKWFSTLGREQGPGQAKEAPRLDLAAIRGLERAVVFKHSRSCPVSWAASTQVRRFQKANPSVPVYTVTIQEDRELSRAIEAQTGIRHESPQVIVFRDGEVVDSASHEGVTERNLEAMVA